MEYLPIGFGLLLAFLGSLAMLMDHKKDRAAKRDPTRDEVWYALLFHEGPDNIRSWGTPFDIEHKHLALGEASEVLQRNSEVNKITVVRMSASEGTTNMWEITRAERLSRG